MATSFLVSFFGIFITAHSCLLISAANLDALDNVGESMKSAVIQDDGVDLNNRVSKIEDHSRNQDKEIVSLKTALDEEMETSNDLRSRVERLEDSLNTINVPSAISERDKRPARLLPFKVLMGKEKNKTDQEESRDHQFYGPANGCDDLRKLGYTLNGYYLVNGREQQPLNSERNIEVVECRFRKNPDEKKKGDIEKRLGFIRIIDHSNDNMLLSNSKTKELPKSCEDLQQLGHSLNGLYSIKKYQPNYSGTKIETVYCDFHSPTSPIVTQDVIGEIDVKTKSVHFYVQRNSYYGSAGTVIPFQLARLNEGDAFDLTSGIFTAPVPGIYHFQFSGLKPEDANNLSIFLQLNGTNVGEAFTTSSGSYASLSLSASLRLVAGDKVNLFFRTGMLEDSNKGLTHFSGWLVEEYLK